ncbi:hypothetical protein MTY66_57620 [Mycolicibacterium sp. TY66]|nr:hypothetical protein MTY66_57620 [Mycolicibacterium sp. TY66]BCJ84243.1 hypothetical protein MTY81_56160 [Mycolicibacterium sp. TY81]
MVGRAGTALGAACVAAEGSVAATVVALVLVACGVTAGAADAALAADFGLGTTGFDGVWGRDDDAPVVGAAVRCDRSPAELAAGLVRTGERVPLERGGAERAGRPVGGAELSLPACAAALAAEAAGLLAPSWPGSLSAHATAVPVVSAAPMMAAASPPTPYQPALTVIARVYVTGPCAAAKMARLSEFEDARSRSATNGFGPVNRS